LIKDIASDHDASRGTNVKRKREKKKL